jgi:hypothetical protein
VRRAFTTSHATALRRSFHIAFVRDVLKVVRLVVARVGIFVINFVVRWTGSMKCQRNELMGKERPPTEHTASYVLL